MAILLVNTAGPGGVRHASPESLDTQLMMACNLSDPSIEIDNSWWDPIGMRATVSHVVHFKRTFISDADIIGYPGQYLKEGWQTCFIPHYAATFLGAAEAAFDYAMEYITTQRNRGPLCATPHRSDVGERGDRASLVETCRATLGDGQVSGSSDCGQPRASRHGTLAEETVKHCIRACGARCLIRPSVLERIYRDLSMCATTTTTTSWR